MNNKERIEKAVQLFNSGCNCSQAITVAFADLYGFTEEQAMRLSAGFGGGIGRMRETCGAACGMFILAGMDCGSIEASDRIAKSHNYAVVQQLAAKFKEQTGSLICAELLGLKKNTPLSSEASERTPQYYAKRPCPKMIETAAKIFADYLDNK
ncbi:MAG: C_GCAxxG_C_C family protein [Bacteroidaceae bacterium]|nr:C_GCAxxG_C_C family protein [Bacteroidaceae bacterium]